MTVAGHAVSYIDFDAHLIDQKVCVRRDGGYTPAIANVVRYEEFMDKFEQLKKLNGRRAFAERKQLEELDVTKGL